MTPDTGRPTRLLAVMDAGGDAIALETAAALADRHGAALEALACVEPPADLAILARLAGRDLEALIAEAVRRRREEMHAALAAVLPGRSVAGRVVVGKAYLEIIRHAARAGCDLVIKTAEPLSGVSRFLFHSTDQHLMRKCPCPVWLQTAGAAARPRRVLAAVDLDVEDAAEPETLTSLNRRVIDAARSIADGPDAEIVVLHAWEALGEGMIWAFAGEGDARLTADAYIGEVRDGRQAAMRRFLAEVGAEMGAERGPGGRRGPRLVPHLARGAPERVIAEKSRELRAEVVVMGTVARTGLSGVFIGNTAENIINSLDRPVLAVKPEGFASPLAPFG